MKIFLLVFIIVPILLMVFSWYCSLDKQAKRLDKRLKKNKNPAAYMCYGVNFDTLKECNFCGNKYPAGAMHAIIIYNGVCQDQSAWMIAPERYESLRSDHIYCQNCVESNKHSDAIVDIFTRYQTEYDDVVLYHPREDMQHNLQEYVRIKQEEEQSEIESIKNKIKSEFIR